MPDNRSKISQTALGQVEAPSRPTEFSPDLDNEDHLREVLWHKERELATLESQAEDLDEHRKITLDRLQLSERASGKTQWESERLGRTSQEFCDHIKKLDAVRSRAKILRAEVRFLDRKYRSIERHQANTRADMWRHK